MTGPETALNSDSLQSTPFIPDKTLLIAGRYQLLRPLGVGGMGHVYLAEDILLSRRVAVKTIRPELSGSEEVRDRIRRESRMHAAIGAHPNIITLYDTVEEDGHIYLVLEYFDAETLVQVLARQNSVSLTTALQIIRQLLQALACIHQRNIVHRDIKTSNILLCFDDEEQPLAKLTDFGIARAEQEDSILTQLTCLDTQGPGTPVYMAPERIDPQTHGRLSPATDLYAAGIILFELLAGKPPFRGAMTDIFTGHLMHPPGFHELPGSLPANLLAIIKKALAKPPADRYQDADTFLAALDLVEHNPLELPARIPTQDKTLLMPDDEDRLEEAHLATPTILVPTAGNSLSPDLNGYKQWFISALALTILVAAALVIHWNTTSPVQQQVETKPADPGFKLGAPVTTDNGSTGPYQTAAQETTALQVVEKARVAKTQALSSAATNEGVSQEGREWQVIDNQSRKIH